MGGPICTTLMLSKELENAIRSGLPLKGFAGWPPRDDDLDLTSLPADLPPTVVNSRRAVSWRLTPSTLDLILETHSRGDVLRVQVEIRAERDVWIRSSFGKKWLSLSRSRPETSA
jgi:hypothetical protein